MLTTLKTGYYIGIDGGATKTEAVIANESGFVLGRGGSGGANPHNLSVGEAFKHLNEAVNQAKAEAREKYPDKDISQIESVCLGLAGIDTRHDRENVSHFINSLPPQTKTFGAKRLVLVNDGLAGLKSGYQGNSGICLIAGTGSNCYGINQIGKEATAGDWGYILGDQGSAFAIGRKILRQVVREHDGRSPKSTLTTKVLDFLRLHETEDLVSWTYRDKIPVTEIASLSRLCDDEQLSDSIEIALIINDSVTELIMAYQAVIHRLGYDVQEEIPVVLVGGLFSMKGKYANQVVRSILNYTPNASVIFPSRSPAQGAVHIAQISQQSKLLPETTLTFINPEAF